VDAIDHYTSEIERLSREVSATFKLFVLHFRVYCFTFMQRELFLS